MSHATSGSSRSFLALGVLLMMVVGLVATTPASAAPEGSTTAAAPSGPTASSDGAEATLPSLPLPDCMANGLTVNDSTDCEGTVGTASLPAPLTAVTPAQVQFAMGTRELDFRKDADRVTPQSVTFTWTSPAAQTATGPDGSIYRSSYRFLWPTILDGGTWANHSSRRRAAGGLWEPEGDGAPYGTSENPPRTLFVRLGSCGDPLVYSATKACTYKVAWGAYDRRVRDALIYRVGLPYVVSYNVEKPDHTYACTGAPDYGCGGGTGWGYTTFRTDPPEPLKAYADVKRLGPKQFEFDSSRSGPAVVSRQWTVGNPVINRTNTTFTVDFATEFPDLSSTYQGGGITLSVKDRWDRTVFAFGEFSFLQQVGTQGPLKIKSFTLVSIENGVAKLKATVENTTADTLYRVGLLGNRIPGGATVGSSPASVTLAGGATADFDVTVAVGALSTLQVQIQAFGLNAVSSPVKSAASTQGVDVSNSPLPTCTPDKPTVTGSSPTSVTVTVPPGTCPAAAATAKAGRALPTGWRLSTYQGTSSTPLKTQDLAKGATSAVVTGLEAGKTYRFKLSGINAAGSGPLSVFSSFAMPPFTNFDGFVNRQFVDFALRNATTAEKNAWGNQLSIGTLTPVGAVDKAVDFSAWAPTQSPVIRLFQAYFLRLPDTGGLTYWSGTSRAGLGLNSISAAFASSAEFRSRYGSLSNRAFVNLVYQNVLGRPGEAQGVDFWTSQLDSKARTRGQVMVGFSESPEYKKKTKAVTDVVNVYTGMLRRVPTAVENTTWTPQLAGGTPRATLIAALLATPAYDART